MSGKFLSMGKYAWNFNWNYWRILCSFKLEIIVACRYAANFSSKASFKKRNRWQLKIIFNDTLRILEFFFPNQLKYQSRTIGNRIFARKWQSEILSLRYPWLGGIKLLIWSPIQRRRWSVTELAFGKIKLKVGHISARLLNVFDLKYL